jgi:SAM-dependent methyltransferase
LSDELSEHARANRALWDRDADEYQERHREHIGQRDPRWGIWQIPEDELQVLGDVSGKDVLELGCGAAQWSIRLAARGARVVGLDNSERQLEHARKAMAAVGVKFPLVHASAERVPLPEASFDVVFADHGANRFSDPYLWVPEAARLLRSRGLLAFSGATPIEDLCWSEDEEVLTTALQRDYFGMNRKKWQEGLVEFNLVYGDWIRLFRRSGFLVEDLIEIRPPEGAVSTYRNEEETEWARRWPMEHIWRVRKT